MNVYEQVEVKMHIFLTSVVLIWKFSRFILRSFRDTELTYSND